MPEEIAAAEARSVFDQMFNENSYRFRPNRSYEQAITKLLEYFFKEDNPEAVKSAKEKVVGAKTRSDRMDSA